ILVLKPGSGWLRRVSATDEAVPAPKVAFARNEAPARRQLPRQRRAFARVDNTNERKPRRECWRRLHETGERMGFRRQMRSRGFSARPTHGRVGVRGRVEIIAECGCQRALVASLDF